MPLAVVFGTSLDLLGGLCVAGGWPWLVGSSVPPATQAQYSIHHQHCHLLLHVLYHPLLTQVREELLHSSRPPHPPPAVTGVPKLQPSHFQASHPSDYLSGTEASPTPQHSAHGAGLTEKKVKLTMKLSQALGQLAVVTTLGSFHGRPGWQHCWYKVLPGWVLSAVTVLLLTGFASSAG